MFNYSPIIPWTLGLSLLLSAVDKADCVCHFPEFRGDFADLFVQLLGGMAWISLFLASIWCWLSPLFYHSSGWEVVSLCGFVVQTGLELVILIPQLSSIIPDN